MPKRSEIRGTVGELAARVWWCHRNIPAEAMRDRLPYMAFFDREFYGSDRVDTLTGAGEAAYLRCCVKAFRFDVPGCLPMTSLRSTFRKYKLGEEDREIIAEAFEAVPGTDDTVFWNRGVLKSWIFAVSPIVRGFSGGKAPPETRELFAMGADILEGKVIPPRTPESTGVEPPNQPGLNPGRDGTPVPTGVEPPNQPPNEPPNNPGTYNPESVIRNPKKKKREKSAGAGAAPGEIADGSPSPLSDFDFDSRKGRGTEPTDLEFFVDRVGATISGMVDGGWWASLPRFLQGKPSVIRDAWRKAEKAGELLPVDEMIEKAEQHARSAQWADLKFVPGLAKWIERGKFREDLAERGEKSMPGYEPPRAPVAFESAEDEMARLMAIPCGLDD
jgi:hypothetical protein